MERGLYIAASGMLAEQVRQDQLANDLANASTPGYKADNSEQASFSDLLLWNSSTGAPIGSLSMGSRITHVVTDLTQGPLQSTGDPLDVALDGAGFLAVATGSGVRYTRDGQLMIDARGRLCTDTGNLVLGTSGKPITVGQVSDPTKISIDQRGTVKVGNRTVGTLAVMSLTGATKQGDTLFTGTPGVRPGRHDTSSRASSRARASSRRRGDGGHDRVVPLLRDHPAGDPVDRHRAGPRRQLGRQRHRSVAQRPIAAAAQEPRRPADNEAEHIGDRTRLDCTAEADERGTDAISQPRDSLREGLRC